MRYGVGCRLGSDPTLLWLWYRLEATADWTPTLGTSPCLGCSPAKDKKKKKRSANHLVISEQIQFPWHQPYKLSIFSSKKKQSQNEHIIIGLFSLGLNLRYWGKSSSHQTLEQSLFLLGTTKCFFSAIAEKM